MPKKEEEFDIEDIYTPLSVAKKEIWRRWNDPVLRKKVEDFLGGDVPEVLKKGPRAIIGRNIGTPNKEFLFFLDLVKLTDLPISVIEYTEDIYTGKNPLKYHLCKMYFYEGLGKNGGNKLTVESIVDFKGIEGRKIDKIKTKWKQKIVDFHHEILDLFCPNVEIINVSKWFGKNGKITPDFYSRYLSLFTIFGILFENYTLKDNEKNFTETIAFPSIRKIEKMFGVKPLIVPILPLIDEVDYFWYYYPESLKNIIKQKKYELQSNHKS